MTTPQRQQLLHTQYDNQYKLSLQIADGVNWTTFQAQPYYNLPAELTQIPTLQSILQQYIHKYYAINNNLLVHLNVQIPVLVALIQALFTSIRHHITTLTPFFEDGTLESAAISTWKAAEQSQLGAVTARLEEQTVILKQLFALLPSLSAPDLIPEQNHSYVPYFHSQTSCQGSIYGPSQSPHQSFQTPSSPPIPPRTTESLQPTAEFAPTQQFNALQDILSKPDSFTPLSSPSAFPDSSTQLTQEPPIPDSFYAYIQDLLTQFHQFDQQTAHAARNSHSNHRSTPATQFGHNDQPRFPHFFTPSSLYKQTSNHLQHSTDVSSQASAISDQADLIPSTSQKSAAATMSSLNDRLSTIDPNTEAQLLQFLSTIPIFADFQPLIEQDKLDNIYAVHQNQSGSSSSPRPTDLATASMLDSKLSAPTPNKTTAATAKGLGKAKKGNSPTASSPPDLPLNSQFPLSPYFAQKLGQSDHTGKSPQSQPSQILDQSSSLTPIQYNLVNMTHNQPHIAPTQNPNTPLTFIPPHHGLQAISADLASHSTTPSTSTIRSAQTLLKLQQSTQQLHNPSPYLSPSISTVADASTTNFPMSSQLHPSSHQPSTPRNHSLFYANHASITQFILHLLYTCYFSLSLLSPDAPLSPDISSILNKSNTQQRSTKTQHTPSDLQSARARFYYILQLLPSITTRILFHIHHSRSFATHLHASLHHLTNSLSNHLKYLTNTAIPLTTSRLKYPWLLTPPSQHSDEFHSSKSPKALQNHLSRLNCLVDGSNLRALRAVQAAAFAKSFGYMQNRNSSQVRAAMLSNVYALTSSPSLLNLPGKPQGDLTNSTATNRFVKQFHEDVMKQLDEVLQSRATISTSESITSMTNSHRQGNFSELNGCTPSTDNSHNKSNDGVGSDPKLTLNKRTIPPARHTNRAILAATHPLLKQLFLQVAVHDITGCVPLHNGSVSTLSGREIVNTAKKGAAQWKHMHAALRTAGNMVLRFYQQQSGQKSAGGADLTEMRDDVDQSDQLDHIRNQHLFDPHNTLVTNCDVERFRGDSYSNPFWGLELSLEQTDELFMSSGAHMMTQLSHPAQQTAGSSSTLLQRQGSTSAVDASTSASLGTPISVNRSIQLPNHSPNHSETLSTHSSDQNSILPNFPSPQTQKPPAAHFPSTTPPSTAQLLTTPLQFDQPLVTSYALPFDPILWDNAPSALFFDMDGNHVQMKPHPSNPHSTPHNSSINILREQYQTFLAQNKLTPLPAHLHPLAVPSLTHSYPDQNLPIKSSGMGHFAATSTMYSAISQMTGSITSTLIPQVGNKKHLALTSILCRNKDQIIPPYHSPLLGLPALSSPLPTNFATNDLVKAGSAGQSLTNIFSTLLSQLFPTNQHDLDSNQINQDSTSQGTQSDKCKQQRDKKPTSSARQQKRVAKNLDATPITEGDSNSNLPVSDSRPLTLTSTSMNDGVADTANHISQGDQSGTELKHHTDFPTSMLAVAETHVNMSFIDQDILLSNAPIEEIVNNLIIRALTVTKPTSTVPVQPDTNALPGTPNYIGPVPTSSFYSKSLARGSLSAVNKAAPRRSQMSHDDDGDDDDDTPMQPSSAHFDQMEPTPILPHPAHASNYLRFAPAPKDKDKEPKDQQRDNVTFITANGVVIEGLNNVVTQTQMPNVALYADPDALEFDHRNERVYDALYQIVDSLCEKANEFMNPHMIESNSTSERSNNLFKYIKHPPHFPSFSKDYKLSPAYPYVAPQKGEGIQTKQTFFQHHVNREKDRFSFSKDPISQLASFSTVIHPSCSFIDPMISAQDHLNAALSTRAGNESNNKLVCPLKSHLNSTSQHALLHNCIPNTIFSHVSEAGKLYSFLLDHFKSTIADSPGLQKLIEILSPYPCQSGCVEDHSVYIASYLESTILHNIIPLFTATVSTVPFPTPPQLPHFTPLANANGGESVNTNDTVFTQDYAHHVHRQDFVTTSQHVLHDMGLYPTTSNQDEQISDPGEDDFQFLLDDADLAFLEADCNPIQATFALPTPTSPQVDLHALYNASSTRPFDDIDFSTDVSTHGGKYKQQLVNGLPTTADESFLTQSTHNLQSLPTVQPSATAATSQKQSKTATKVEKQPRQKKYRGIPPKASAYNYLATLASRLSLPHHRVDPIPISILSAPELQHKRGKLAPIAPDYSQIGQYFPGFGGAAPYAPFTGLIQNIPVASTAGGSKKGSSGTQAEKLADKQDKASAQYLPVAPTTTQLGPSTVAKSADPRAITLFQSYMQNYKNPSTTPYEVVQFLPATAESPAYCFCQTQSLGEMVGCENNSCPFEWFHFQCVGISSPPRGQWWCLYCINNTLKKGKGATKITKKIQNMAESQERVLQATHLAPRVHNKNCKVAINTTAYYQFVPNSTGELVPINNEDHGGHPNILTMFQNVKGKGGKSHNDFDFNSMNDFD